jgi:DHA1 family multidrug resistance protein-like MFS transporter
MAGINGLMDGFSIAALWRAISIIRSDSEDDRWRRNVIFLCIAQFFAMLGMGACVPFLSLFIMELGIQDQAEVNIWSGLVFAGPYILSIFTVPFWGMLGDRNGMKKMVFRAIIGLGIAVFIIGFAQNVMQLFLMRVFQGAVSGFIAAAMAFISMDAPIERRGYSLGLLQSAYSAGHILGPLMGGIISDTSGLRSVFFIVGILCFIGGGLVYFFVREKNGVNYQAKSRISIGENLRYVSKNPRLKLLLAMIFLAQGALYFPNPLFPLFVKSLGAPVEYLSTITGLLVGMVGIFSIIFSPYWGRKNDSGSFSGMLIRASLITGLAFGLHSFMPDYLYIFPLRAVIGIFYAAILPIIFSAVSKIAPEERAGGIMGLASSATILGSLISFLLSGVVATALGIKSLFIIAGITIMLIAAFAGLFKRVG